RLVELVEFALEHQAFLLAHALGDAFGLLGFHFLQTLDGRLDGLEVGHHAAQPTAVDVGHAAALSFFGHDLTSGALGADEQYLATTGGNLTQVFLRLEVLDDALLKVDDMNLVTLTEDIRSHLRVPVTGLVAEMDTRSEEHTSELQSRENL